MREILQKLLARDISIDEAENLLRIGSMEEIEDASLDIRREIRAGIPEVVWGESKTPAKTVEIAMIAIVPYRKLNGLVGSLKVKM